MNKSDRVKSDRIKSDGVKSGGVKSDGVKSNLIKLDQFLKWKGAVQTGGEAKLLIQDGHVSVNGDIETRRGRKLVEGDRVELLGRTFTVRL